LTSCFPEPRRRAGPTRLWPNLESFGTAAFYGWSEDKARQYSVSERADFGAFIRKTGLGLK